MRTSTQCQFSSSGESFLGIYGEETPSSIDKLIINTLDRANIEIKNVKVNAVSGSLSDESMVNMPVIYLKQIVK